MRKMLITLALGLGIVACDRDSPTAPAPPSASPAPVPSAVPPSPSAPANQPPVGSFRVNPAPPRGEAPLQVAINMCRSTDPEDPLRFSVDFGDGATAEGGCALEHTYRQVGGFQARACVSDGQDGEAHTQCQTFGVRADAKNLPPDVSNLRVAWEGHSTSRVSFLLWDEHEPVAWTASVKALTPQTYAGCFLVRDVVGGCVDTISGESGVGPVEIRYREGMGVPGGGPYFVLITIRAVDPQGKTHERSLRYRVI